MDFNWRDNEKELREQISKLYGDNLETGITALEEAAPKEARRLLLDELKRLEKTGYLKLALGPKGRE